MLTALEKRRFEDLFNMSTGWVLDFVNASFARFFRDTVGVDIMDDRYATYGTSKAKRLNAYWDTADDKNVGKVLEGMLGLWRYNNPLNSKPQDEPKFTECQKIAARLLGDPSTPQRTEKDFLKEDFGEISANGLDMDAGLDGLIDDRIREVKACLSGNANLAAIFMCGSILEGVLLNAATKNMAQFNQATASPKGRDGKVKAIHEWTLSSLIDVSFECGLLRLDVKKFSHGLRDFRNYIHPHEQRASKFDPDAHTARICYQVLRAVFAGLREKRSRCQ